MNDPITNSPAPEGCPAPICSDSGGAAAEVEEILAIRLAMAEEYKFTVSDESIERDLAWAQWARSMSGKDLGRYLRVIQNNIIVHGSSMDHAITEILKRVEGTKPRPNKFDALFEKFRSQNTKPMEG